MSDASSPMTRDEIERRIARVSQERVSIIACNKTRDGCEGGGGVKRPHELRTTDAELATLRAKLKEQLDAE